MRTTPIGCLALLAGTLHCPAPAQSAGDIVADSVVVTGQRAAYRSLAVAGATKTDALPLDLPQSVRTLGADLLRDAGVTTLSGALDLASGIARQSNLGGLWDSYAMRGFTGDPNFGADYLVNGFSASRGYNGMRDAAGTQSIEILKGPASALYGRGRTRRHRQHPDQEAAFRPAIRDRPVTGQLPYTPDRGRPHRPAL
jgi:iron complex outermembrane receptor protein